TIIDTHTSGIHRPQCRGNITLVIKPRPHPEQVATRDKFAGHLSMSGRERLKDVEHSSITNRPRNENETESEREDGAEKNGLTDPPQRSENQREANGGSEMSCVWTNQHRESGQ